MPIKPQKCNDYTLNYMNVYTTFIWKSNGFLGKYTIRILNNTFDSKHLD